MDRGSETQPDLDFINSPLFFYDCWPPHPNRPYQLLTLLLAGSTVYKNWGETQPLTVIKWHF